MSKTRSDLRVLLLQIRDTARVREEEHESFALYSRLKKNQIEILNVFDRAVFSPQVVDGYDALFIGGASEASVMEPERYTFVDPSQELILYCVDRSIPVFASCFGFQLAVIALGGEIIRDKRNFEMGTVPIHLTQGAQRDPIFWDTPDGFLAVSVHQEKALNTPSGCQTLAYTQQCIHSFRVQDKPFWCFQFHPEVDRRTLVERLTIYKEHYTKDDDHLDQILSTAQETSESNALVRKFVDRVLVKDGVATVQSKTQSEI